MEWLNYHHLLYFWTVAKEGSIARACQKLHLTQPTISEQLRLLEESLGEKLFAKKGPRLVLTEVGQITYHYAEKIFGLGQELQDVLKGRSETPSRRLLVGISALFPKLLAYRALRPVLRMTNAPEIVCDEGSPEYLLGELAEHRLDVVLSDTPIPATSPLKVFSHFLGSSAVMVFAAPSLAARYRKGFPKSLDGAPFLMPMEGSSLRRPLEQWFDAEGIRPRAVAQFKGRALMATFGQAGDGLFAAPVVIAPEVRRHYRVAGVGRIESIVERFYAVSVERKLKNPNVAAISNAARASVFSPHPVRG